MKVLVSSPRTLTWHPATLVATDLIQTLLVLDARLGKKFLDIMTNKKVLFAKGSMNSQVLTDMIQAVNVLVMPHKAATLGVEAHKPLLLSNESWREGNADTDVTHHHHLLSSPVPARRPSIEAPVLALTRSPAQVALPVATDPMVGGLTLDALRLVSHAEEEEVTPTIASSSLLVAEAEHLLDV
jgi:hypothetical protein